MLSYMKVAAAVLEHAPAAAAHDRVARSAVGSDAVALQAAARRCHVVAATHAATI
jgi:hypothetical protein